MSYLPPTRELRVRLDTAQALTRLFYREQAIVLACGRLDPARRRRSTTRPSSVGPPGSRRSPADALRERVFELRYPTRFLDEQAEELSLGAADELRSMLAELRDDYGDYLARRGRARRRAFPAPRRGGAARQGAADRGAFQPGAFGRRPGARPCVLRFLHLLAGRARPGLPVRRGRRAPAPVGGQPPERGLGGGDRRDASSTSSPRSSAGSSRTEAARWLYDETRHMLMGKERLARWGFEPAEIPLGGYIYEACAARGSRSTASGCSGTSRRRTSGASGSARRRSTRWAT